MFGLVDSDLRARLGISLAEHVQFMSYVYLFRATAPLAIWAARNRKVPLELVPPDQSLLPDRVVFVDAQDGDRKIRVEVYEPPGATGPLPVHISLHGSGFVVPLLGMDSEICRYFSTKLNCVVLDADYAKGPWHPAPSALNDVLAVIEYAKSQPTWIDGSRLTTGGYSAGGCLALLAAAALPKGEVKCVTAWYPAVDLRSGIREEVPAIAGDELPGIGPGQGLSPHVVKNVFGRAYLQPGVDPADPRISPICCEPDAFPPITLIVGTKDPLYADCVAFHRKLEASGHDIDFMHVPRGQHGWERYVKKDMPVFGELREEAFRRTIERLRAAHAPSAS